MASPSEPVERIWLSRLRWRMRGAWLWPAFLACTLLDGILIELLPPYAGTPPGLPGGLLLAGFANLGIVAVLAPLAGRVLRRRRRDLPRAVATDTAGTALVAGLAAVILAAGLAHRPSVAAERDAERAVLSATHGYVTAQARGWAPGLATVDVLRMAPDAYRACVPGRDPRRWLCLLVDTDQSPPGVRRDDSMEPNSGLRAAGGFR